VIMRLRPILGPHPLHGVLSVEESAAAIGHYRCAEERMMRIMAGWIAVTPELAAKLVLGRHVGECAQHADGWRRLPGPPARPPSDAFARFLDRLESPRGRDQTPERLVGVYRVLKPYLTATYELHLASSNAVYERPTRRLLGQVVGEERAQIGLGVRILLHLVSSAPRLEERADRWEAELTAALEAAGGVTPAVHPGRLARSLPDCGGAAQELIGLASPAARWPIPGDLKAALDEHARHLKAGDVAALEADLAPGYRERGLEVFKVVLRVEPMGDRIVAFAKAGPDRLVRWRLDGPRGAAVLTTRWERRTDGWQILDAEVSPAEAP